MLVEDEFVLAVPKERLVAAGLEAGFVPAHAAVGILDEILTSGDFCQRKEVEHDPGLLQPIPSGLIHCNERVLVLERRERNKRSHLHGRLVLWAGGHVQLEDSMSTPADLLTSALERELAEELLDLTLGTAEFRGIVWNGRSLHFGVIYDVPAHAPGGSLSSTNHEFRLSRGKSPSGYFLELEALDNRYDQLESWSKIILADILLRRTRLRLGAENESQLEFDFLSFHPALSATDA